MAQIIVTDTQVNLNVATTQSNITVTDLETNVTVNVASLNSSIAVTNETVNVVLAPSIGVSNSEIRAALSVTTPLTYDSINGIFGFDASANAMQVGSLTSASFVDAAANIFIGDGLTVTNNATIGGQLVLNSGDVSIIDGNYTQTGSNIVFGQGNIINGSLELDNDITIGGNFNGTLKDFDLSYYDAGDVSGNVVIDLTNGNVQKIRLTSNVTGLSFTGISNSTPVTLIVQQDSVGFWQLDTSTFAGNWSAWKFVNNFKTLTTTANAYDLISINYDGTNYYASVVNFVQTLITNSELANSSLTVNGVTISLGSQGNITTGNISESGSNLYWTEARSRGALGVTRVYNGLSNLTYSQSTGIFTYTPVTQNDVRSQLSATSPIVYNNGTGVISLSGTASIATTGNISGNYILGNGALLTGIVPTNVLTNAQVVSYIATQPLTVGGNLTVNGNINATGNINVQNVEDLYVRDQTIVLNANAASAANVQIVANRPSASNTMLKWNEQTDRWTFTNNGTTYYNMPESTTDLAEGSNLYYTTDRANTAIGAYQGDINTAGTITSGTANATTVNATTVNTTDLNATNNIFAAAGHIADGSNIQYVRAWNVNFESTNTSSSLNLLLESDSNNRIAVSSLGALRYVPSTRTLFVTDGTIGSNDNNLQGNNLSLLGNINSSGRITASGNIQGDRFSGNAITVSGNAQAAYFIGNGSLLTGIVPDVVGSENILVTGNVISLKNALGNVNSVTAESAQDLTLTTATKLVVKQPFSDVTTNVGNITGDGYAFFQGTTWLNAPRFTYSGAGNISTQILLDGSTTAGSNAVTGITDVIDWNNNPISLSSVLTNSMVADAQFTSSYPFPSGTYVTSVDSANNTVYMSQNAIASTTLATAPLQLGRGAYDSTRGQVIFFVSEADYGFGNAQTIADTYVYPRSVYGYPRTGFVPDDFSFYSIDSASSYAIATDISKFFIARTQLEATQTVMNFPRGLTVGDADLTNRAENDSFPSFGMNILWDGLGSTADYGDSGPFTQLLLKQYKNNSFQQNTTRADGAPRIFFTVSNGDKSQPYQLTYPTVNTELGRIAWWAPTSTNAGPSSVAPPAYINAITLRDMTQHNGGVGMYFATSPHTDAARRGQFLAHHLGNTVITSSGSTNTGANNPITFAPMATALTGTAAQLNTSGNAIALYNNTMAANNYQWATINFDSASAKTGSRLSVTNGVSTVSARNGNLVIALDRNDNGAGFGNKEWAFKLQPSSNDLVLTEDDVIRTTFSGGNVSATTFIGNVEGAYGTFTGNVSASAANVDKIKIDPTAAVTADSQGEIVWNTTYGGLDVAMNGINLEIGQQQVFYGKLTENVSKGNVIMFAGAQGDHFLLAKANVDAPGFIDEYVIGLAAEDGNTNDFIYVTTYGRIDDIDTQGFGAGNLLYLSTTTPGALTNVEPTAPNHAILVAAVAKAETSGPANNGVIFVRPTFGKSHLDSLHDVLITSPTENQILTYDSGNTVWVNENLGTAITSANVKLKQFAETVVDLGNVTGDISANIDVANGTIYKMSTTGSITINSLANAVAGTSATLIITNGGSHTLSSTMKFAGGSKTLSTGAGDIDIISVFYDGTTYYATLSKGYA